MFYCFSCFHLFIICLSRMVESGWYLHFMLAPPQQTDIVRHPNSKYHGKIVQWYWAETTVGDTGTIPHCLHRAFPGAPGACRRWCDLTTRCNGMVLWYVIKSDWCGAHCNLQKVGLNNFSPRDPEGPKNRPKTRRSVDRFLVTVDLQSLRFGAEFLVQILKCRRQCDEEENIKHHFFGMKLLYLFAL